MASSARIDELRKKFDENPRRYFAPLANEYRKSGDLQQAVFICQEYLPQQPGHMSGHIVYGQALFEMGRLEEANAVFETALSLDPENLIALRHLGDIARQGGDLRNARIWYQRVLEADPRNEEIAQLMISLLATPEPVEPAPIARDTGYAPAATATPISTVAAARAAAETADDDRLVVEKSEPAPEAPAPAPSPFVEPAAPPHATSASKAGDGHDFLDLDDFNLGGVPLPSAAAPEEETFEAGIAFEQSPSFEQNPPDETPAPASEPGFDLGMEDGPFEADPYAIAAAPVAPDVELATDLRLGLPDEDEPMLPSSAESELESESEPTASALDGLETFEPGVIAVDLTEVAAVESFERDEFFDVAAPPESAAPETTETPAVHEEAETAEASESTADDSASVPPAFVTETMAELYLRQGHLDSALDIYRRLVEQRPHDALLQEQLRAVEERVHGAAAEAAAQTAAVAAPMYGGPTIREFLSALASRRTPLATAAVEQENAVADHEEVEPVPPAPSSSGTVSGSIDALFSGAEAAAADVTAATTLQEAFAEESADTAPLRGVPAHTASSELSLDHVFKGNAPPPPDNDGFSFDQFFAEEMTDTSQHATREGAAAAAPADDIAQFNAWLNGLKKT